MERSDLIKMDERIRTIKKCALELKAASQGIQAVDRNCDRILASVRMLEINIGDLLEIRPSPHAGE